MTTNETSPEFKTYRVYATDVLFQDILAASAADAYRVADDDPCFEPCGSCLKLDPDVKDLETDEFVHVGAADVPTHCKTCGVEIMCDIKGSNFGDGECGGCEYQRYKSQPALFAACRGACGLIYRDKNDDERIDFEEYEQAELACKSAVTQAQHGNIA